MTGIVPTSLAPLVQRFFAERLVNQFGASANTIASYRDTFRLLLEFAEARCGKAPTDMNIPDIDADLVADFLEHLETERGNSVQSRNVRLAAIRKNFLEPSLGRARSAVHRLKTFFTALGSMTLQRASDITANAATAASVRATGRRLIWKAPHCRRRPRA